LSIEITSKKVLTARSHLTILGKEKKKDNIFDQFSICFVINSDPIFGDGQWQGPIANLELQEYPRNIQIIF
jgi:hypothetical protein